MRACVRVYLSNNHKCTQLRLTQYPNKQQPHPIPTPSTRPHTHARTHRHTNTDTHAHTDTHTRAHTRTHTHTHAHTHTQTHTHTPNRNPGATIPKRDYPKRSLHLADLTEHAHNGRLDAAIWLITEIERQIPRPIGHCVNKLEASTFRRMRDYYCLRSPGPPRQLPGNDGGSVLGRSGVRVPPALAASPRPAVMLVSP